MCLDGSGGGAGHDSFVAQRVLGADGRGHHGRAGVATVLTLLALPAMYAAWFRVQRPELEYAQKNDDRECVWVGFSRLKSPI